MLASIDSVLVLKGVYHSAKVQDNFDHMHILDLRNFS